MNRPELYAKIKSCVAHIIVRDGEEVISEGSGFSFLPTGEVLTAAHVVCGGWPITPGEADLPTRSILVRFREQGRNLFYRPLISGIQVSMVGLEPIVLDVALLVPVEHQDRPFDHLVANIHPPRLGDELYMAGYSDEVAFPFALDRNFKSEELREQQRLGINTIIGGTMIKRGVVGNVTVGSSSSLSGGGALKITQMYLDNHVHSGASGGPIVDENGEARGIISMRAVTATFQKQGERLEVPSGSCVAYGLDFLSTFAVIDTGQPMTGPSPSVP